MAEGEPRLLARIEYPEKMPEMFKVNLAKEGLIYPPHHNYWKEIPNSVFGDALKMLPDGKGFMTLHRYDNGGIVRVHRAVDTTASDYEDVLSAAKVKVAQGKKLDILPRLDSADDPLYEQLFKEAKKGKYPDLRDGKTFIEVDRSNKSKKLNNLKHSIDDGSKQANQIIVNTSDQLTHDYMKRVAKGRFIDHKQLRVIEFLHNGKLERYTRNMFK